MIKPIFITGNQSKADYLSRLLGIQLEHRKLELDEIQSLSLDEIAIYKVKQAYDIVKKPVLVEDQSLGLNALSGLPGPFIKFFIEAPDGLETLCRLLNDFNDRSARAECVFAYYDGAKLELFRGGLNGVIATSPRGNGGFGWDKIFCPKDFGGKTRAELSKEDDEKSYQIIKPFAALKEFLSSK